MNIRWAAIHNWMCGKLWLLINPLVYRMSWIMAVISPRRCIHTVCFIRPNVLNYHKKHIKSHTWEAGTREVFLLEKWLKQWIDYQKCCRLSVKKKNQMTINWQILAALVKWVYHDMFYFLTLKPLWHLQSVPEMFRNLFLHVVMWVGAGIDIQGNFPPQEPVTFQINDRYNCVMNESGNVVGTSK